MINQIKLKPRFKNEISRYIRRNLLLLKGGEWDKPKSPLIKEFKMSLRKQLLVYQDNKCAYCGLKFERTGKNEIEHIAPKGGAKRPRYVQYTFTVHNLVLACNLCNSPFKKGQKDTIDNFDNKNKNYRLNEFNIYHPYFDNPDDHFEYSAEGDKIIIIGKSIKGKLTIEVFDLDGEPHCTARAEEILYAKYRVSQDIEDILNECLSYQ